MVAERDTAKIPSKSFPSLSLHKAQAETGQEAERGDPRVLFPTQTLASLTISKTCWPWGKSQKDLPGCCGSSPSQLTVSL